MNAPSAVSISDMPAANRIGSESTARNGTGGSRRRPRARAARPRSRCRSRARTGSRAGTCARTSRSSRKKPAEEEPVHEAAVEQALLEPLAVVVAAPDLAGDPDDVEQHDQVEDADDPEERPGDARADRSCRSPGTTGCCDCTVRAATARPAASENTMVEWPSEKKKPTPSGRLPCASIFRVVLSIAAMWSASKAWRRPKV